MSKTMCFIGLSVTVFAAHAAVPDFRPPFDKSDYKGSVSVQANPWFPLNKPAQDAYGGPNRTWKHYEGANLDPLEFLK